MAATSARHYALQIAKVSRSSLRHRRRLALAGRLVLDDIAGERTGGHRQRTRQVHLPRPAAPGEVAVLRADDDLVRARRNARPGIDARAATGLDDVRARLLEDVEITLADAVLARFLRAELQVELAAIGDALALSHRRPEHARVHVHVFVLAGGAGAAVGDLDGHGRVQLANELAIAGIARRRDHGINLRRIQFDRVGILRVRITV